MGLEISPYCQILAEELGGIIDLLQISASHPETDLYDQSHVEF